MLNLIKLGENIQYYRGKNNMTQAQLAQKLFVSFQAVSNWERGATAPDLENLFALANLLNVSTDRLLKGCEHSGGRYLIGIDGGGTKTEFVLFSDSGKVARSFKLASSNPNDVGIDKSCEVLAQGIDMILSAAPDVSGIFAGVSGGSIGDIDRKISEFLCSRYKTIDIHNDSDIYNVLMSGGAPDSIALICGTGSVAFTRFSGKGQYIGGWGHLFDKSGSAYSIGRDAVSAALRQQNGLGEKTLVTELLVEIFEKNVRDALDVIYDKGKAYIASLSHVVFTAHSVGDKIAAGILQDNAAYLAELILCAQGKYGGGDKVVAGGGIFENRGDVFLPMIKKFTSPGTTFIIPDLPPVYGACLECCYRLNIPVGEDFHEVFLSSYAGANDVV